MLLIYTPHTSNRFRYVINHIFKQQLGIPFSITNEYAVYQHEKHVPKFMYDEQKKDNSLFFYAAPLLKQINIQPIALNEGISEGIPVLFATHNPDSALNFDIFSAVFYLLSRYEEYIIKEKDQFGNFDYQQSILYRLKTLDTPVVEQWIELLKRKLQQHFPELAMKEKKPRYALSFDIDVAYAYRNKNPFLVAASIAKKLVTFDWRALLDQILTLSGVRKDCFDTYEYIFNHTGNHPVYFFFNMGKYARFDKNPSSSNRRFRGLIRSISHRYPVGLHPSYASNKNVDLLAIEQKRLEQITGKKINISRQHYLKLKFPTTYQQLLTLGITKDFTMGYYFHHGFRGGTCHPFYFFDLQNNKTTSLQLFPFVFMDGTLNNVYNYPPEEAIKLIGKLVETVHRWNGVFIPIWHNSTLSEKNEWKQWRSVFEAMIGKINELNWETIETDKG